MQNIQKTVGAGESQKAGGGPAQSVHRMSYSEKQIHTQFVEYGRNAKEWMRKCVMLLPEIDRRGIWRKKGFGSIYEYATKLAGMSKNTVDDALRILEKLENKPALLAVAESRGLGAVRPVITVATPEDEKFWAEKAAAMSKHAFEAYVREFKKQGGSFDEPAKIDSALDFRPGTGFQNKKEKDVAVKASEKMTIVMDLEKEVAETLLKLKGRGDWNTLMKELLELREEKLQREEPEPLRNAKRYIPARIRRHVLAKTRGQCAYPGCKRPYDILHHTQRFALKKVHDPRRLVPLCVGHERLAHQGLIEGEREKPEHWRLKKEPDRDRVEYAVDRRVMRYRKYK